MKILVISDIVEDGLYNPGVMGRFGDVDLVLSCGDLPPYYLEYLVSTLNKPLYFVCGNHGPFAERRDGDRVEIPGCVNIDTRVVSAGGLLIAGLEGSMRYKPGARYQYTEMDMFWKIMRLVPRLLWNKLRHGRFLDILVTHAPPAGIHDAQDPCHRGFKQFLHFMDWFAPRYHLHGHMHLYLPFQERETDYKQTRVINAYGYYLLDIPA